MKLKNLEKGKILILGFAREGRDTFVFLRKLFPKKILGIADKCLKKDLNKKARDIIKKDKKIKLHLGRNYLEKLKEYEIIIKSPGIPFKKIRGFLRKNQQVTSQTEIFFSNCPGKIIGITGTKGKSTTASLIYKILKENRIESRLAGNIGRPMLSFLSSAKKDTVYILELSSHQLFKMKKSPHIAVFLNVFEEHLDYYSSFQEYYMAKANITKYQKKEDFLIFNSKDKIVKKIAVRSKAQKIPLNNIRLTQKNFPLKGKFNLQNIKASLAVAGLFGIKSKDALLSIKNFEPLPHRLEYTGCYKGIEFYNDALSTIPEATLAALEALGKDVETIFLGGFDRGIKFNKLVKKILGSPIKNIILFPETGDKIWREMIRQTEKDETILKKHRAFLVQSMEDAVKLAFEFTSPGKICLLSNASPSFGIFKDYKEKGELFKKYIKKYGKC